MLIVCLSNELGNWAGRGPSLTYGSWLIRAPQSSQKFLQGIDYSLHAQPDLLNKERKKNAKPLSRSAISSGCSTGTSREVTHPSTHIGALL